MQRRRSDKPSHLTHHWLSLSTPHSSQTDTDEKKERINREKEIVQGGREEDRESEAFVLQKWKSESDYR
ncbi:hypothetical protein V6N11_015302 [Hibiscus sabdariffa]|uniref:Uncharacterized protein n=1 Tax=Hibiscus sabdariffa TaxID=183260 RepID=A0ABR2TRP1_9ROSI